MALVIILGVLAICIIAIVGYFWLTGKFIDKAKVFKKKDKDLHLD